MDPFKRSCCQRNKRYVLLGCYVGAVQLQIRLLTRNARHGALKVNHILYGSTSRSTQFLSGAVDEAFWRDLIAPYADCFWVSARDTGASHYVSLSSPQTSGIYPIKPTASSAHSSARFFRRLLARGVCGSVAVNLSRKKRCTAPRSALFRYTMMIMARRRRTRGSPYGSSRSKT